MATSMKLLTMLLLTTITCLGQDTTRIEGVGKLYIGDYHGGESQKPVITHWYAAKDSPRIILGAGGFSFETYITWGNFIDNWKKYKAECYSDSSYVDEFGYWEFIPRDTLTRGVVSGWQTYKVVRAYYIHKQPTFIDFMAWLEKKYWEK